MFLPNVLQTSKRSGLLVLMVFSAACIGGVPEADDGLDGGDAYDIEGTSEALTVGYSVVNGNLQIEGVGTNNPVLYDNDWWNDIGDDDWTAGASLRGEINLKGWVVTRDMWDWANGYLYTLQQGIDQCEAQRTRSTSSGQSPPACKKGSNVAIARPGNGQIGSTVISSSDGSTLIVNQARAASQSTPLLVFVGGPASTVATAILQAERDGGAPIGDKMIVFSVDSNDYNAKDPWAWYVVAKKTKLVLADHIGNTGNYDKYYGPYDQIDSCPANPACTLLKSHAKTGQDRWRRAPADGIPLMWLTNRAVFSGAERRNMNGETFPGSVTANSSFDFLYVYNNIRAAELSAEYNRIMTSSASYSCSNAAPTLTSQPASRSVAPGSPAAFSVAAAGCPAPTYQWRKNGVSISGATSASYTTPATTSSDNGASFSVAVTNSAGSVTSNNATLTVTSGAVAPAITTQPASASVSTGGSATFSVTASGSPAPTYQWRKNGVSISGATTASYTTPATTLSDNGATFSVVVTNSAGSATSHNATLTVTSSGGSTTTSYEMELGALSGDVPTCIAGQNASNASGGRVVGCMNKTNDAVTISKVNGGAGGTCSIVLRASNGSGATNKLSLLVNTNDTGIDLSMTSPGNGLWNTFKDSNTASVTMNAGAVNKVTIKRLAGDSALDIDKITVTCSGGSSAVAPAITTQPASVSVSTGAAATFSVTASGSPAPTYQWRKNGASISGATSASYTTPATTSSDNGASFSVVVTNSAGSATSNNATLTVTSSAVAPAITTQPASVSVSTGAAATFSVTASGSPAPTYQWRKNGVSISGATSASYTTPATTSSDNGASFSVVVTNSAGSATSNNATLTVTSGTVASHEMEDGTLTWDVGTCIHVQTASNASGGKVVGCMNKTNDAVTISTVNGGAGGTCSIVLRASNGSGATQKLSLLVNDVDTNIDFTLPDTGGWNTFANTAAASVVLGAGPNKSVTLKRLIGDSALDIDKITVSCP